MRTGLSGKIQRLLSRWINTQNNAAGLRVVTPQEGYERWAASYGEDMNPVQQLESQALKALLPSLEGCTVLDLGCGRGRVSRLALEKGARKTVGLDFSRRMLRRALAETQSPSACFLTGSAENLPFKPQIFDVVICALMMGHLPNVGPVLTEISRVLRPGGCLLISDFHPQQTLRGAVRSFRDMTTNRCYAIEQHPHLLQDYRSCLDELGFALEDLQEPLYEGIPLVFVLRAMKS